MGEAKFTPGPWRCSDSLCVIAPPYRVVATMAFAGIWNHGEQEANSALVTAAPDLYEASGPVEREAQQADYYCQTADDDHVVLIQMTMGELRALKAARDKACPTPPDAAQGSNGGEQ